MEDNQEEEKNQINSNAFLTQQQQQNYENEVNRIGLQQNEKKIYHIDLAEIPQISDDDHQMYLKMPNQVEFKNLVSNILNSRNITLKKQPAWRQFLSLEENKAVISDCFWFAICKYKIQKAQKQKSKDDNNLYNSFVDDSFQEEKKDNTLSRKSVLGGRANSRYKNNLSNNNVSNYTKKQPGKFDDIMEKLLNRVAKNYVNLLLSIEDQADSELFFKTYFDIVAQAVLYSFFYAFPKSRREFNNDLKRDLITWFSQEFTGIPIANSKKYWSRWNLYLLGEGNILEAKENRHFASESDGEEDQNSKKNTSFPEIPLKNLSNRRNKRAVMDVRFSPIIDRYINRYKYKTRNTIQKFKMKFTEYDKDQDKIEKHFKDYEKLAENIQKKSKILQQDNELKKISMNEDIRRWKQETVKHHRRLEKRKAEELERGCHEYANYLVSMLNAGLSNANLGVTNQKGLF